MQNSEIKKELLFNLKKRLAGQMRPREILRLWYAWGSQDFADMSALVVQASCYLKVALSQQGITVERRMRPFCGERVTIVVQDESCLVKTYLTPSELATIELIQAKKTFDTPEETTAPCNREPKNQF